MTLKLIAQPNNKTCGQTSVAMVAGISVEESIKLFGHNKSSRTQMYRDVLDKLGIKYGEYTKIDARKGIRLPNLCLVRLQKKGCRTGHLVAYKDGVFYDPSPVGIGRKYFSKEQLLSDYNKWSNRWRFDYYMEIYNDGKPSATDTPVMQMVAGDKRYKVTISYTHADGRKQILQREINVDELEKLKQATQFKIVTYDVIGE